MKENINIAEIQKDKKDGIRLYSPIFGECTFCCVREDTNDICVKKHNGVIEYFNSEGLYFAFGEVMLFPSKSMRDWEKLSWKKGDLLINSCGFQCIFKEWASDDYTKFNGCYSNSSDGYEDVSNAETSNFVKLDNNTAYGYIREIEKRCGGTLNLETLEIEKTQPEFKDGDIIKMTWDKYSAIAIFWEYSNFGKGFDSHVFFNIKTKIIEYNIHGHTLKDLILRLATEEEKQQLFDALAKKGKQWYSEKKMIVDLKPKVELKPFDKVLVRDFESNAWQVSLFGYKDSDSYSCCNGCSWNQCIPYIGNESLLGTTKDVEG